MFKKTSYKNYDEEDKGNKQKVKKILLIALAIIVGIIVISLALTNLGYFPGNVINRIVLNSYLDDNYPQMNCKIESYKGFDDDADAYIYNCIVDGKKCEFAANDFSVQKDGYYEDYCRNHYFEKATNEYMSDYLEDKWAALHADYSASWDCSIDIPLSDKDFPAEDKDFSSDTDLILDACKKYGGSFEFTVKIYGKKLTMEEYHKIVYYAVNLLQKEMDNRPTKMQVFYYRTEKDKNIMQFESTINTYQFGYSEPGIAQSSNLHKYVEVPEDIQRNYKIYNIAKNVVIIVITITVISLSALWIVRKIKKIKKNKNSFSESEEMTEKHNDNNNDNSNII